MFNVELFGFFFDISLSMIRKKLFILSVLFFISSNLLAQRLTKNNSLQKNIEICNSMDFQNIEDESSFVFCKRVYTQNFDPRKALEILNIGSEKFPYNYDIRLQKVLTYQDLKEYDLASKELSGLIHLYPERQDLHNYMARIQFNQNKVESIMPFVFVAMIAPKSPQSKENRIYLKRLLSKRNFDVDRLKKKDQNNFMEVAGEMNASSFGMLEKNEIEKYARRLNVFCLALKKHKKHKEGLFWDYYAPYFIELNNQNLVISATKYIFGEAGLEDKIKMRAFNAKYKL